jgi:putative phosphoesterase
MKIGVVSDTHSRKIPLQLLDELKAVDFIIHAGDFCSVNDLQIFKRLKEVKAVYGNMDEPEVKKREERALHSARDALGFTSQIVTLENYFNWMTKLGPGT